MKRVAIFAHFDIKNKIDDYVIFYLKELTKIVDTIIFVSACNLSNEELNKVSCYKIAQVHEEYDFGSYKRGFFFAKKHGLLEDCDELIFANDSCYGPFKPLNTIFNKMEFSTCDFWGLTQNNFGFELIGEKKKIHTILSPHLQSYFLVFRKNVFTSKIFEDFLNSIKKQELKNQVIIEYEIGCSKILRQNGFKSDFVYKDFIGKNPTIFDWRELFIKADFPFIKCSLLRLKNKLYVSIDGWKDLLTKENLAMIEQNLSYTAVCHKINTLTPLSIKKKLFSINRKNPPLLASIVRKILATIGSFLTD